MKSPTARIVVLRAVRDLWSQYDHGVTMAAISVASWKADVKRFGLGGWKYPDSNRVVSELVRLVKAGFLYRPAPARYSLTEKGRDLLNDTDRRESDNHGGKEHARVDAPDQ